LVVFVFVFFFQSNTEENVYNSEYSLNYYTLNHDFNGRKKKESQNTHHAQKIFIVKKYKDEHDPNPVSGLFVCFFDCF